MCSISHVVGITFADNTDYASATGLIPLSSFAPVIDVNSVTGLPTDTLLTVSLGAITIAIASFIVDLMAGDEEYDADNQQKFHFVIF